jgi:hypothetical protein
MDVKVRGCDATLTVDPTGMVMLHMLIPDMKDEVTALKKMKEWGIVRPDKPNTGKPAVTVVQDTTQ